MRRVTTNDAEQLAELEILLFPDNCFNETTLKHEIAAGRGLVECDRSKIVGYALTSTDGHVVDLTRLGVHPDYRRLGIGTMLLRTVLTLSQKPVMLSVLVTNQLAFRMYQRNGFSIVGKLDDTSWVMQTKAGA